MPGLYTHFGSMTFPPSSFALLIFSVAKIMEIDIKRELSASLFPGQTLIQAELNGGLIVSLVVEPVGIPSSVAKCERKWIWVRVLFQEPSGIERVRIRIILWIVTHSP